jgi:hypothetical protein
MQKVHLIRRAAGHAAAGAEILNQMVAIQTFEDQSILHVDTATEEIAALLQQYKSEMGRVSELLYQYLEFRKNGHLRP